MTNETTTACPHCDSTAIDRRSIHKTMGLTPEGTEKWRCRDCQKGFDDPVRRERKDRTYLRGLARRLSDADADEVSG